MSDEKGKGKFKWILEILLFREILNESKEPLLLLGQALLSSTLD